MGSTPVKGEEESAVLIAARAAAEASVVTLQPQPQRERGEKRGGG